MWTLHKIKSDGIFPNFKWNQVFVKVLKTFSQFYALDFWSLYFWICLKQQFLQVGKSSHLNNILYIANSYCFFHFYCFNEYIDIFVISCTLRDWHITGRSACFPVTELIYYYSLKRYNQNIAVKKAIKIWRFWRNSNLTEKYFH